MGLGSDVSGTRVQSPWFWVLGGAVTLQGEWAQEQGPGAVSACIVTSGDLWPLPRFSYLGSGDSAGTCLAGSDA